MKGFWYIALLTIVGCGKSVEPDELSWHEDVQPMLDQHCTRCHTEGGQGVGDFTDLDEVRLFSPAMLDRMESGEMPPPVSDPACRDYSGSEYLAIEDDSIQLFSDWVAGDMTEGDPANASDEPAAEFLQTLSDTNLRVEMPTPYYPNFNDPAEPGNEYRCFVLEHGQTEPFYITGMAPSIGEPAIVHHVVLFKQSKSELQADYDPAVGYNCIDDFGLFAGMLGGWAPGATPVELEDGYGFSVSPDDNLVVQIHYYSSGPETTNLADQSGYNFRTTPTVNYPLDLLPLGGTDFVIPAGDDDYTAEYSQYIPESFEYDGVSIPIPALRLHGVFPHMHVLGSGYRMWIEKADATEECAVDSEKYDFYNQLTYMFRDPLDIEPGDTVHWSCSWNNSTSNPYLINDPPQDVRYGERTDEEMCFMFSIISTHY